MKLRYHKRRTLGNRPRRVAAQCFTAEQRINYLSRAVLICAVSMRRPDGSSHAFDAMVAVDYRQLHRRRDAVLANRGTQRLEFIAVSLGGDEDLRTDADGRLIGWLVSHD